MTTKKELSFAEIMAESAAALDAMQSKPVTPSTYEMVSEKDRELQDEQAKMVQAARAELAAQPIVTYPGDGFNRGYDASDGEY